MNTDSKPQRFLFSALVSVVLLTSSLPASATTDYYLKFTDGGNVIEGSSVVKGREKQIEITSFNWGVSAAAPLRGSGSAGKPVFKDFSWTQTLDASTENLYDYIFTGKVIDKAEIFFERVSGADKPLTYFTMTFEGVSLTNLDIGAGNRSDIDLYGSFAYEKVTLDYFPIGKDGKLGAKQSASYDLAVDSKSTGQLMATFARGLVEPQAALVPEPETYAMFLAGLGLLGVVARRRQSKV